jgi:hypothetical protein
MSSDSLLFGLIFLSLPTPPLSLHSASYIWNFSNVHQNYVSDQKCQTTQAKKNEYILTLNTQPSLATIKMQSNFFESLILGKCTETFATWAVGRP